MVKGVSSWWNVLRRFLGRRDSNSPINVIFFADYIAPKPLEHWRNHFQSELQTIPAGVPVELVFDLRPTAWRFSPGKQIRITVAFADAGNFDTPFLDPAPVL